MNTITIHIKERAHTYPIIIGNGILKNITDSIDMSVYSKIVVVTDSKIEKELLHNMPQWLPGNTSFIVLPFGEQAKTIETVEDIWRELIHLHCDRASLVINIGGGVICDIGGFAASTYMRGIDFINIPTTLLSQVDASVGGKTGINFEEIKNSIGTFQQPKAVVIDVQTLTTLPDRIFHEGFGEIIKHGIIADKTYFSFVSSKKPNEFTQDELIQIITKSCEIKRDIVEKDVKEKGIRRLVNFGHTIGHAIESVCLGTQNPLLHGEAVSIGMIAESYISLLLGLLSENEFQQIVAGLKHAGLPISITNVEKTEILKKIQHDKKQEHGKINWTLITGIGRGIINQAVPEDIVEKAIEKVIVL